MLQVSSNKYVRNVHVWSLFKADNKYSRLRIYYLWTHLIDSFLLFLFNFEQIPPFALIGLSEGQLSLTAKSKIGYRSDFLLKHTFLSLFSFFYFYHNCLFKYFNFISKPSHVRLLKAIITCKNFFSSYMHHFLSLRVFKNILQGATLFWKLIPVSQIVSMCDITFSWSLIH